MENLELLDQLEAANTSEELLQQDLDASIETMQSTLQAVKKNLLLKKAELDEIATTDLVPIKTIANDEHLKTVRKILMDSNRSVKEVADMRLNTTRPIDAFKKDLIDVEREICAKLTAQSIRVKGIADGYEIEEARKRQAERDRQQRELDIKKESEKVLVLIRSEAGIKLTRFINQVADQLRDGFGKITLVSFDEQISLFNSFKPVLKFDTYKSFFGISGSSYNNELLTMSQVLGHTDIVMQEMPLAAMQKQYELGLAPVIEEIKQQIPIKRQHLEDLAELAKSNQQMADRLEKENQKTRQLEQQNRANLAKQQEKEKRNSANLEASKRQLETHIESQKGFQSTGPVTVKKSLIKATVISPMAYRELVEFYIRTGGDQTKLDFLADFAAKNGQPKIEGLTYNV